MPIYAESQYISPKGMKVGGHYLECASAKPLWTWIEESSPGNNDESKFTTSISASVRIGILANCDQYTRISVRQSNHPHCGWFRSLDRDNDCLQARIISHEPFT